MDDIDPYTLINEQSKKWNAHGVSLVKSSKLDEALNSFEKAIDCDSSNFKAYKNMSIVYTKLNKNNDAAYHLNKSKEALKKLEQSFNSRSSSFIDNNIKNAQKSSDYDKKEDSSSFDIMGYVESITGGSKTKTVCIGLFIFFSIIGAILPHNSSSETIIQSTPVSVQPTIQMPIPTNAHEQTTHIATVIQTAVPTAVPLVEQKPNKITLGGINAAKKARDYLNYMPFSRSGLIDQLEFDGFSRKEAEYGVDQSGANWNEQAAKKARDYLNYMSFSRSGLIDQLEFDGFSHQQAEYGVQSVGY